MARVSDNVKERIRERIDMLQLVSEYVSLKPKGPDDFWGRCPFHEEKSASFHISPGRGLFNCFGCHKGGDVFRFVEEIEGISFGEVLRRLGRRTGVELESASPQERAREERRTALLRGSSLAATFFQDVLWSNTPAGEKGRSYLAERGIEEAAARAFGLGMAPDDWGALREFAQQRQIPSEVLLELGLLRQKDGGRPYDFFRDRLMFPIRDEQGKVRAFGGRTLGDDDRKYMNSPEIPGLYEKRKLLYGLDRALGRGDDRPGARRPKRLVVVEGYMDVVVPHQAGRTEFVAALGTAFTEEQAKLARRYVDEVVLLFDADEAGTNASLSALAKLVGQEGLTVKVASLADGKDPDEVVRQDPQLLDRALDEAQDLINFIIEQTMRGYALSSPAGQERAIRAAIRLLARIPDKIRLFRELKVVAHQFGLPEQVLRDELIREESVSRQRESRRRPRSDRTRPPGPALAPSHGPVEGRELHLLEALLAVPEAAARIAAQGGGPQAFSPGPTQVVAGAIFSVAAEGLVEPARVMARIEDPAARSLCDRLIGRIRAEKQYEQDLAGFAALERQTVEARLKDITRRIREAGDKDTKNRLLAEHTRLRAQLQPGPTVAEAR